MESKSIYSSNLNIDICQLPQVEDTGWPAKISHTYIQWFNLRVVYFMAVEQSGEMAQGL